MVTAGPHRVETGLGNLMTLTPLMKIQLNTQTQIAIDTETTLPGRIPITFLTIQPSGMTPMAMAMVTITQMAIGKPTTSLMMRRSGPIMTVTVTAIIPVGMSQMLA